MKPKKHASDSRDASENPGVRNPAVPSGSTASDGAHVSN